MGLFWGSYTAEKYKFSCSSSTKPESLSDRITREATEEVERKLKRQEKVKISELIPAVPFLILLFWLLWFIFII